MKLSVFIVFILIVTACSTNNTDANNESTSGEEPEFILEYSDDNPPGGMRTDFIIDVWIPEIEKQTDNRVKVNTNMGGSLFDTSEALAGVEDGLADIAMISPEPYPNRMFAHKIFQLFPKAAKEWENLRQIYSESFEEIPILKDGGVEDYNQKLLLTLAPSPLVFGATYEFDGLEDVSGNKWRAAHEIHLNSLANMGAETVSVPWEEVYTALQTNVTNGVVTNFDGYDTHKFYEVAENALVAPELWYSTAHMHTINMNTWDELPED